jgi:hypothetical protein
VDVANDEISLLLGFLNRARETPHTELLESHSKIIGNPAFILSSSSDDHLTEAGPTLVHEATQTRKLVITMSC